MANVAVMASGNGSNFQAIAEAVCTTRHTVACLVVDRANAYARARAERLGIPGYLVSYAGRPREAAEDEILTVLAERDAHMVALAGFMRILTPHFLERFREPIINIHPALLPKHPGSHAIEESFRSGDDALGVTVHRVDAGVDTGPIIAQESFRRTGNESLEAVERRLHDIEHQLYPRIVLQVLDTLPQREEAST
jgi:phosphoribosylglycinamide formyltransferase 1